ncbi:MAG: inositol monophosphatase family protein [Candidatus Diapherotrites archaeon]
MNLLEACVGACLEASKFSLRYFRKNFSVRKKGVRDLVTEVDLKCENAIKRFILRNFKGASFLCEESGKIGSSESFWVVDPIDGTTNFVHGIEFFSHSVAFFDGSKIVCGAVFNPVLNKMFCAELGKGAFLNGSKIRVSTNKDLIDSLVITGFPYASGVLEKKTLESLGRLRGKCRDVRRFGSAALDFCFVAEGAADVFFEYFLNPWDVAAGLLIVQEAGGKVTNVKGSVASIFSENFVASNGLVHDNVISFLSDGND